VGGAVNAAMLRQVSWSITVGSRRQKGGPIASLPELRWDMRRMQLGLRERWDGMGFVGEAFRFFVFVIIVFLSDMLFHLIVGGP
jgi:hypothetical protein